MKRSFRLPAVVLAVSAFAPLQLSAAALAATAACLPSNDPNSAYVGQYHQWTPGGIPYDLTAPIYAHFSQCTVPNTSFSGATSVDQFSSQIGGDLYVNGGFAGHISVPAQVSVQLIFTGTSGGGVGVVGGSESFATQMTQLDATGPGFEIRIDPIFASNGSTTITNEGGGLFRIDSFFDVFTDLSLDGGQTWTPSSGPGPGGSTIMTLETVPEPSTILLLGAGCLALTLVSRRKHR